LAAGHSSSRRRATCGLRDLQYVVVMVTTQFKGETTRFLQAQAFLDNNFDLTKRSSFSTSENKFFLLVS
jgi:hypothetical protein